MVDLWVKDCLAQRIDRLNIALFESYEGKASTTPCHVVAHYRTVYYLAKALEIVLNIALYIQQSEKRKVRHSHLKAVRFEFYQALSYLLMAIELEAANGMF